MNGTYHPGWDEPILEGSSALTFLPPQVLKCPSPHLWKQVVLFPEPAMNRDPGKSFLLYLSTLLCLPPELFVFAEWTWPSVTVTQLWKRDAFIFPRATLYCSGDTSRKKKGRKQQQTASVMKRERLSFHSSHVFTTSRIKGPARCVVISVPHSSGYCTLCPSRSPFLLLKGVFLLFLFKNVFFLNLSPGKKCKVI